jgi:integrase/recombinase XerD
MSSDLHRSLEEYLSVRRSLGYKLDSVAPALRGFVGFAEQSGADTISTELALAWAVQPSQASPIWLAHRLSMVRGFARYLHAVNPATEIPPAGLLCARGYRPAAPYLYSEADITALMAAAGRLAAPLRAATFQTLIGLLAVTGLRIGEAMRLDRDDIDWDDAVLQVRDSKFGRSREVLCHDSTIAALRAYSARRDQLCPRPSASPSFFVTATGTRLMHNTVYPTFHELVRQTGLHRQSPSHRPRVHDLRHAFAVRTLIRWYRDGEDVEARLPLLSTYLGHANPAATFWYYSDSRVIPMSAPLRV